MRYMMRQKLFPLGGKFNIQNEAGADVYCAKGRMFSIGN
jgi:uncharacterized protein YxjI